ncbi:MAG: transposase [bacterium]|nr:transposase [bacterium]
MSRVARVVVPGFPHHVTQRGNRRADVFEVDADREAYLRFVKRYASRHGLAVWAYCLMTNHVHLVVVPSREDSLGLALRDAHTVYAMHFNTRTELSGHVWQGRFHSCPMDEPHLWAAVRYVERNPVRAGLVDRAEDYRWSSASAHCDLRKDPLLSDNFPPPGVVEDWKKWLSDGDDDEAVGRVRAHTHTGRPCGSPVFLDQLESLLQRVLRPKKRGRKPKPKGEMSEEGNNS